MAWIESDAAGALRLAIKAVPGASRDQIAGLLGDRLKLRIAAPPEGGKANRAICALLAAALGIKPSAVSIIAGATGAEKTVAIQGVTLEHARAALLP